MAPTVDDLLSDLQKKVSPSIPEVTRIYLEVLKASKPSGEESLLVNKLILKFVEFLKGNLQVDPEKDGIQMLFIELIFLIAFLMDPLEPAKLAEGKLILTHADAVVDEVPSLISSFCSGEIKEGIDEERNLLLHNFLEKANAIKAEVRKIYAHLVFAEPSSFNFPRINLFGFIDSLLQNLREFPFHFPMLWEELLSLKEPNLKDFSILELQNKRKGIEDLWTRIVNVVYKVERAISSITYLKRTLWPDILCLSDAIGEMKLIKGEMKSILDQHIYDIHAPNCETGSNPLLPLQADIPTVDIFVGFKNEIEEIRGRLIRGSSALDIISIIGMPGLGKTTLAKKIFCDASVRYHFNRCAWCTVSQTYNSKRMLLDIINDVNFSIMKEEDLAEKVYKGLKGQRYLIVMDDIWDASAWYAVKMSFPDDKNGSRIIFTSRNHNVISEASPFPLNPLSEEESWELLKNKLFDQDGCREDLVEIGKHIAKTCEGLPLAIVLIAGLLKEKLGCLFWWKQVGEGLHKLIAKEGFMNLLELSYKHLPEVMKPCFLYMGSFAEDEEIRVKKLILLWISEGFIQKHELKSLEAVAEEYLMELVARSLVIVTKRSSRGGIKACVVHDLLREFCIAKGEEEKVFKVIRGNDVSDMAAIYSHYRVSIQTKLSRQNLKHFPHSSSVHSLHGSASLSRYLNTCFKFLHVLDLGRALIKFPEKIAELILLRYLAINANGSENIRLSIRRLKNLETLYLNILARTSSDFLLPIWELQKLRHIHITQIRIPPGSFRESPTLENVQTCSSLVLPYGEESEMFLRKMTKVQKLKCEFGISGPPRDSNKIVKLDYLTHLESLHISHRCPVRIDLDTCEFRFPSTLKKLYMQSFGLPWSEIHTISKLPNLEVLKLHGAFCGETWDVEDEEFLKLKFLKLSFLNIQLLNASDASFPCLEGLHVSWCPSIEKIPSRFESIPTLKMIEVESSRFSVYDSARRIQEAQVELGNEHLEVLLSEQPSEPYGDF